ncbi:MAG: S-layer homology domain-containing protein [Evtepia sp.]
MSRSRQSSEGCPHQQAPLPRDVPAGAYYEDAVVWAVGKGITSGTNATTFDPNGTCTRAQAVTFLWRAAGSPTPKTKLMPFPDVPVGSYYWNAVLWAIEQGITEGTSYLTFSPNDSCTRAQIVTFLWRAKGNPAVTGNAPFTDVPPDAYYAAAVTWAEKNGITGGIGNGLFGSNNTCTRAQIADVPLPRDEVNFTFPDFYLNGTTGGCSLPRTTAGFISLL